MVSENNGEESTIECADNSFSDGTSNNNGCNNNSRTELRCVGSSHKHFCRKSLREIGLRKVFIIYMFEICRKR